MEYLIFDMNLFLFFSLQGVWLDWFHSFNCFLLLLVIFFVTFSFFFLGVFDYFFKLELSFGALEFWGCFIPVFFLVFQVCPSLFLLFSSSLLSLCNDLSVKVVAHQWYWSYELGDSLGLSFDSYMVFEDSFFLGDFRLLEVDNRLVLPQGVFCRFVLTSSDVIHSWALPVFFLKVDVMSGLLNILNFNFDLVGVFFGQCSEICGANHSFMPVVLELTLFNFFSSCYLFLSFILFSIFV
uniref:cytochrome-c oxidase n=1 Tax=Globodera pallida TaxID=36090 RepID=Q9T6M4_GLOPA|nr:cytochrome oxidase subunit II [Globodera pallida]